jgi:DNA-binding beta-propeller fold protein YncE
MPNGLVVDGVAGELLVADGGNNRVMVFPLLP